MAVDSRIPLMVPPRFDAIGSLGRAAQAVDAQRRARVGNELQNLYAEKGDQIADGDMVAVGELARLDPGRALEVQGEKQRQRAVEWSLDRDKKDAQLDTVGHMMGLLFEANTEEEWEALKDTAVNMGFGSEDEIGALPFSQKDALVGMVRGVASQVQDRKERERINRAAAEAARKAREAKQRRSAIAGFRRQELQADALANGPTAEGARTLARENDRLDLYVEHGGQALAELGALTPGLPEPQSDLGRQAYDVATGLISPQDIEAERASKEAEARARAGSKPLREGETRAASLLGRMRGAEQQIARFDEFAAQPGWLERNAGRVAQDADTQGYIAAKKEWMAALLRKDTGAAVTDEEFALYNDMYFAQPYEAPAVIRQKADARARAAAGLELEAGRALEQVQTYGTADVKPPAAEGVPDSVWQEMTPEERAAFQ